jgi:predicted DNA-binding transcriptional regulator AlpA
MDKGEFWRVKEAASYLNVNTQTIYQWLNPPKNNISSVLRGPKPPVVRFGRNCLRFPVKEFKEWARTFGKKEK